MTLACDFLDAPATPQAIKDAGYTAVLRYLRNTTASDVQSYLDVNLGVGMIFETLANEATVGNGTADGKTAISQMRVLGAPSGVIGVVNIGDFQATPQQIPAIAQYYDAFAAQWTTASYELMGYGTGYIIQQLVQSGCQGLWWQNAENDQGVPGDVVIPEAALYQRVTPTVSIPGASGGWDEDVVVNGASIPWWTNSIPSPTPAPPPSPHQWEDNLQSQVINVSISGGHGWCNAPVPIGQVVSVVSFDTAPETVGQYVKVPVFVGPASDPNVSNGVLVFGPGGDGAAPDGTYGFVVWSVT